MIIYTYRNYGELISTTGEINSQYSYDSRGNMLTKTTDGETTEFSYANSEWQDQLTSVNGVNLAYDANGNLVSDGRYEYQWSGSKTLETITDGENTYSYKYFNGIRSVKTVNGVSTEINEKNGVVLSQSDGTNHLYFQYVNSVPFGFVYNDVQYFYITNLNGDVIGITDAEGNLIVQYAYDEWGKLLSIDAENEENRAVAEINPLRYRGYYYDNETGLYYLQSRYYNPEWCRFISADSFGYINTNRPLNINAYVYCVNNPILYVDPSGNAYVSDAGKAISDFIGIWFLSLEAQERLGDDFAAFVATIFTLDPSLMHFDIDIGATQKEKEERKEQAQKEFFEFFDNLTNEFAEFMKSTFYIMTSSIKGFYLDFFNTCIQNRSLTGSVSITRYLKITFGYGDEDGFISILDDLLHGRIKVLELGNVSIGGIKSNSGIGVFFDYTQSIIGKFFANISFDFNFDIHNLFPPNSGFPVLNEEPGYIIITVYCCFFLCFRQVIPQGLNVSWRFL